MAVTTDLGTMARSLYDAFNTRELDRGAALVATNVEWINTATGEVFHGPDGLKQYWGIWAGAFPDGRIEVTNLVAGLDGVAVEFRGRGTQSGVLKTPAGDVPPSGKSVDVAFCEVLAVSGGKITRGQVYFDLATMMRQLGLA